MIDDSRLIGNLGFLHAHIKRQVQISLSRPPCSRNNDNLDLEQPTIGINTDALKAIMTYDLVNNTSEWKLKHGAFYHLNA